MATKILLLSDTHGKIDDFITSKISDCDQIWHAGDLGTGVEDQLQSYEKPFHAVWGNVDGAELRLRLPKVAIFSTELVKVLITHIGGYPGKYAPGIKDLLMKERPHVFICGHSHILKVIRDEQLDLLHINPGAAGLEGFHLKRTMICFLIEGGKLSKMEVIEQVK